MSTMTVQLPLPERRISALSISCYLCGDKIRPRETYISTIAYSALYGNIKVGICERCVPPKKEIEMANIPAYTADELTARIEDGSIDQIRLAATVGQMQRQVAALAEWANAQIQAQNQTQLQAPIQTHGQAQASAAEPESRKKK